MHLRKIIAAMLLILAVQLVVSCAESTDDPSVITGTYEIQQPKAPVDRGKRMLGIAPSESEQGFAATFTELQKVDVEVIELNLEWRYFESEPGQYQDPNGLLQAISFYGEQGIQVGLSLATINTVQRTDPAYLQDKSFDDPAYIAAFTQMLDWVLEHMATNVSLAYISVGNEVDIYLSSEEWAPYQTFVREAVGHIHEAKPGVVAGVKVTVMDGLLSEKQEQVVKLIALSDVAMLNYYPLDKQFHVLDKETVAEHLSQITKLVDKTIYFTEAGYPSGDIHCQSSEAKQAAFYHTFFDLWDQYASQISLANLVWLHDAAPEQVAAWQVYYGLSDPAFVEYLGTLGVRTHEHTDKAAWQQIQVDAQARGW